MSEHSRSPDHLPPTENMADGLLKGRYLLGPELGRGGFAVAYVAADLELASRKVVVKILTEQRATDSWSLKKFRSEMEALARINHPNVVAVTDFGHSPDGKPFLVMQYIAGHNLRQLIPRDGMPLARVAYIMKQAGRALTAAHEAGVCHRDLKPENVIIQSESDGEEQLKLIDFGLASVWAADAASRSEVAAGTFAYMAPEQFEGRSSFASDVYQMGALAYELVTGNVPFRATTPGGIALQQREGLKVLPRDLRPDLPQAAQDAILKALSTNPQDRYARAKDFGDSFGGGSRFDRSRGCAVDETGTAHQLQRDCGPRCFSKQPLADGFFRRLLLWRLLCALGCIITGKRDRRESRCFRFRTAPVIRNSRT